VGTLPLMAIRRSRDVRIFRRNSLSVVALYNTKLMVGDVLYISGQGAQVHVDRLKFLCADEFPPDGWETETLPLVFKQGQPAQIEQAFENIEVALKHAGGSGCDQEVQGAPKPLISHLLRNRVSSDVQALSLR
jgi:hypothetical protein